MKLCRTCGAPMDDEATFCPMCGADNTDKVNNSYDNIGSEETTVLNQSETPVYENFPQQPVNTKQKKETW